jgi:hypothetical protein
MLIRLPWNLYYPYNQDRVSPSLSFAVLLQLLVSLTHVVAAAVEVIYLLLLLGLLLPNSSSSRFVLRVYLQSTLHLLKYQNLVVLLRLTVLPPAATMQSARKYQGEGRQWR